MEKQVHSNQERAEAFQGKFNKITIFLGKFIFQENFDLIKKLGLVDVYTDDPNITTVLELKPHQRLLFLLFKNKKLSSEEVRKVVVGLVKADSEIVYHYELVNDHVMIVLDFPEDFIPDYDNVVKGLYSKLSVEFKIQFPSTQDVLNSDKKKVAEEYTLYHHIFNKTAWLKQFWMDRLGLCKIEDSVELWEKPEKVDLIFNLNSIV